MNDLAAPSPAIRLRLPYRAPWRWEQFHEHFSLRLLPAVEWLTPHSYSRSFRQADVSGWLRVRPLVEEAALELSLSPCPSELVQALVQKVRRMFDLDAEPLRIAAHFAGDPHLGPSVARHPGLRLPTAFDPFEQAVRAIIGQQVTVKAAVTITGRLVARLGQPLPAEGIEGIDRLFPTPQAIAGANLDGIGMPGRRVQCLQHFAERVASGALRLDLNDGSDALIERLRALPGIGPWTAEYIALRAFGEADAFPASDLGLLKAPLWGAHGIDAKRLKARAEAWRPWRAYAAAHLWHNYAER